jgi:putative phosphoribosyl transferase
MMLGGRTVVIVDDGLVTGSSARAACQVARHRGAEHIVVAVPVASDDGVRVVSAVADEVIALQTHRDLLGIGEWYVDFSQIDDTDVAAVLLASTAGTGSEPVAVGQAASDVDAHDIALDVGTATLAGWLTVPAGAGELVVLAHDSSRERFSARSRYLSRRLTDAGFATLLIDLLTRDEDVHGNRFFAIDLLADRLCQVTRMVGRRFDQVDYVAGGVAAAAVLEAAARPCGDIHTVVCLGGRPDLAPKLAAIRAPVLFIVGEEDSAVLRLNNQALERLTCAYRLVTIPGAGHRLREPGALSAAAAHLRAWLLAPGESDSCQPPDSTETRP